MGLPLASKAYLCGACGSYSIVGILTFQHDYKSLFIFPFTKSTPNVSLLQSYLSDNDWKMRKIKLAISLLLLLNKTRVILRMETSMCRPHNSI